MSAAWKKGQHYQLYVPTKHGGLVQRSTGTSSRQVERGMKRLVQQLADDHRWTLLDAITAKPARLTLKKLYVAYLEDPTLKALEGDLTTPDVVPLVDDFLTSLDTRLGERASGERGEYRLAIMEFARVTHAARTSAKLGDDETPVVKASEITPAAVTAWLTDMGGSTGYRRAAFYRLRSFVRWLVERGTLPTNPVRDMRAPAKGKAKVRYENAANDAKIADAARADVAALIAFIHATGADVTPALHMRRRDFDLERWTCTVPGTKTARRHRHGVVIEEWARPRLAAFLKPFLPNAAVWPGISRYTAAEQHEKACAAVKVEDYTLRDARHSVAIRMIRSGATLEDVSRQLGSSLYTVATVYGEWWHEGHRQQRTTVRAESTQQSEEAGNA